MPKMLKVWNLGNTTIRNPNRIELGLRLFAEEFQGNVHGQENENRFARRLTEEGVVDSEGSYSDLLGRKWRSVLVKLGFATTRIYRTDKDKFTTTILAKQRPELNLKGLEYELTPAGQRLINANTVGAVQDVFLRQLVCHELPSPIEGPFPEGRLKPFIFLLQVLNELRTQNTEGLNILETAIFLQLFRNHTNEEVEHTVKRILNFREKRDELEDQRAKRIFDEAQRLETARLGNVASNTLVDYADTTFRYVKMSGLVTQLGSRLILRDNRMPIIRALLENEPIFLAEGNPFAYLADFYTGTSLPTDNVEFALQEVQRLSAELKKYNRLPELNVTALTSTSAIQDIEQVRYRLIEQLGWAREEEFATNQAKKDSLMEILAYLEAIESPSKSKQVGILDRPAYLEWLIWRSFLAIDRIVVEIHETRRFPLDEDLYPRHPAPGGGADMIFEFEDYVLVVEVTLTSSSRQEAAEGEPVRRHVATVKEKTAKDVYAVFIAPTIDNNTAETFRIGVWYRGDQEDFVNIVPLTLKQFQKIIEALLQWRYTPKDIQQLLDRCLAYRNARAPEWKRMIETETGRWIKQLK